MSQPESVVEDFSFKKCRFEDFSFVRNNYAFLCPFLTLYNNNTKQKLLQISDCFRFARRLEASERSVTDSTNVCHFISHQQVVYAGDHSESLEVLCSALMLQISWL